MRRECYFKCYLSNKGETMCLITSFLEVILLRRRYYCWNAMEITATSNEQRLNDNKSSQVANGRDDI